ncbi:MAG: hypothetical protein R6V12_04705 [Candidatus Hydrogenedentota bacterium]
MLLEAIVASLIVFAVVVAWVLVQQWTASQTYPDECNLPRSECHHCISRNACMLNPQEDIRENADNNPQ